MAKTYANNLSEWGAIPPGLPSGTLAGGKVRAHTAIVTLAGQASGDTIVLGRLPPGDAFLGGIITSSVSLGTSTLAIGDAATAAKFRAAAVFTAVDTPTLFGKAAAVGVRQTVDGELLATVGAAALPGAGTLAITFLVGNA
ncbi:hypothetical protein [Zavarzinia aquatilis]|uniref:Uncharacterized protein n=1 Tax=Zavarzinia aquatilis TaxID=2211142 RepID=A0A317EFW7_9PROT|nr:hypothetical protein [Zavarzinia aquatilis]PWR24980.1 hypothetical protein DKG74_04215 [Zavarzinia aquatilis]